MTRSPRARRFSALRDLPALCWLLALLGVTLTHPFVPAPRWLMIHLLLLGAATHSILVWSRHFTQSLLHTQISERERHHQATRLALLNLGVAVVVAGVLTDRWQVTAAGAAAVLTAVAWHGVALVVQLRRALPGPFATTVHYYVAGAALLPVGVVLGVLLARGEEGAGHVRLLFAHTAVNLLGWVGLAVLGTLVTLWPTMLRTRIAAGAVSAARRALPVLLAGIALTAVASLLGVLPAVPFGLAVYLAGLVVLALPLVAEARAKLPAGFSTWSVLAGVAWLAGGLLAVALGVATASSWEVAHDRLEWLTPALAAGFAAQVLLGALSYLIPVSLGGGAVPVRAANTAFDRGAPLRLVLVNGGLLVALLPVPSVVRVLAAALVLGGLAAFLPLLLLAIRASRTAKATHSPRPASGRRGPAPATAERPRGQATGLAVTGLALIVLAVAAGVAADPAALPAARAAKSAAEGVQPTGRLTSVVVEAKDMRFHPDSVEVPVGNRLVIEVRNTDAQNIHDLVLDSGQDSGRLSPGQSARLDVGVVGRDVGGWCSVVGHRQLGMVFSVRVVGGGATTTDHTAGQPPTTDGAPDARPDFGASPGPGFRARDASLPPPAPDRVHRRTFTISEVERMVAPNVRQRLWTYNGTAPGPVLHGRVGDEFVITLVNDGSIGHSIDFHAGALAPDRPTRTIAPGQSLVYRFTATRAGIWTYHCSTMPMSAHIANGLFGAVVIDPPGLPSVDRSYVLVQSELYLGPQGGHVDVAKVQAERPDAVVFNGYADQYDHAPLTAKVGERVRIWVLDAGPNRPSAFHVIGGQFDRVYAEGAYLLRGGPGGSQVLFLGPAQGGFVELSFPEPGTYPFVSHLMVDAERGAHGLIRVGR